jgi:O-antigen/teichoic acid export membrane protein
MAEIDIQTISKKAVRGAFSLTLRRAALLGLNFITINLILAKILPVSTIGVFNIANSVLAFFTFFSDIGLAAALIRKKELTHDDLKTTFTIQEALAVAITIVVWFLSPYLVTIYQMPQESVWLVRALAVGFLLTSFKVIPSVLLERDLNFGKLVWVEVLETLVFNVSLIVLSMNNFGVTAFSWSVIARSSIGVVIIYLIAPWNLAVGFSKAAAKELLEFGVPFQLNSMLALLKDRLVPLVIARIVGSLGVGYITWGQSIAVLPLEVMFIMTRVTFPAFSRLQDDKVALKHTLEKAVFATGLFLYPALFGILALAPSLVHHVVSNKWLPALPLIYLFSINTFWAMLSTLFTNFLNAIGKIGITLKLMVMWTVLEWILAPILTIKFGFIGMGFDVALISFTSIIPIIIVRRYIKVEIFTNIWPSLLSASLMGVILFFISSLVVSNLATLLLMVLVGAVIYLGFLLLFDRVRVMVYIKGALHAVSVG